MGVEEAVVHPHMSQVENGRRGDTPWEYDSLLRLQTGIENLGMELGVIEGGTPLTDVTRLGLDGREAELDRFCEFVRTMGKLDIPVLCYSWMTHFWWLRTSETTPIRGGAKTTAYDHDRMQRGPLAQVGKVNEDRLWETLEHFLNRVIPVAEEAGVTLALHPDDPPLSPIRGVGRIITSVEAYDRVMELYPSEANGINFCQGNFVAMGADIPEAIRHFGDDIAFVHYRDIEGDAEHLVETWHDDGQTNMVAAMEAYRDIGFEGPARPDHVPTMTSDSNETPGYSFGGRLFAIGYMRGLIDAVYGSG